MQVTAISMTLSTDSDGLVGSEGWGEYDAALSLGELQRQLAEKLAEEYPDAEINIDTGLNARTYITVDGNDFEAYQFEQDAQQSIDDIYSDVWEGWNWLVKA